MERKYIVYMHTFPNGKKYVGITCQKPNRRWRNGKAYVQNKHMTNAINKYGWENIKHSILYTDLTAETAEKIEKNLIADLNLMDEEHGYNYAEGGSHPQHSEKTKAKIGAKSKGRTHSKEFKKWISEKNSGANNFMYGKHHTEETKRKISASKIGGTSINKGKFGSDHPCAKAVIAIDPETGKDLMRFGSIIEAAHFAKVYPSGIQAVLHSRQRISGGYGWRRANG